MWVSPLLQIPSPRILIFIGTLLISGIAIVGGAATLAKKNLLLGVIGATIPLGTSIYSTLVSAYLVLYLPQGTVELSNALPDKVAYIVWPPILVLSILSLVFLAKHAHV